MIIACNNCLRLKTLNNSLQENYSTRTFFKCLGDGQYWLVLYHGAIWY